VIVARLLVCITLAILAASCTDESVGVEPIRQIDTSPARVVAESVIAPDRVKASVKFRNISRFDVVCSSLTTRTVIDSPDTYLERGERTQSLSEVYLRVDEGTTVTSGSGVGGEGSAQIRAVSSLEGGEGCRRATFLDYCAFAKKSDAEQAVLARIFNFVRERTCQDVNLKIADIHDLDISDIGDVPARPIIFLPYLRSVKVEDNLANRRALSEIVRDSQSSAIVATILVGPM
jgi:hypothetical protein